MAKPKGTRPYHGKGDADNCSEYGLERRGSMSARLERNLSRSFQESAGSLKREDSISSIASYAHVLSSPRQGPFNPAWGSNRSNGHKANDLLTEDGFQPALTSSERRRLRKQGAGANSEFAVDGNQDKSSPNYYSSQINKFKSRLGNMGINVAYLPVSAEDAAACKATIDELTDLASNIDLIMTSAAANVTKPLQFKTVEEVDNRIREANENLKRLKGSRGKPNGTTEEDFEAALKENEVFVSYLRDQRVVVEAYQRMRAFQHTLTQFKKACMDTAEHKIKAEKNVHNADYRSRCEDQPRSSRKNEYVTETIHKMKSDKGLRFDPSAITRSEVVIMATAYRFHPPYNYLRRIKEKFCVHIDNVDANGTEVTALRLLLHGEEKDIAECTKFLKDIDFHSSRKEKVEFDHIKKLFGGVFGLSTLEHSFKVLSFYYQGHLDVIGSKDGVNLSLQYLAAKIAELDTVNNGRNAASKTATPANLSEHEKRRVRIQYDYLICKALSTKFRSVLRDVEAECGVSVSISMSPAEPKGTLSVNVDTANVENTTPPEERIKKAVEMLKEAIAPFVYSQVPGEFDDHTMSFLFSDGVLRAGFVSQDFCLLSYNGSPYVVCDKNTTKYGVERVQTLIRCMGMKQKEHFVPMEKTVMLPDSSLRAIEDWTGVTIVARESINGIVLAIYGEPEHQEDCIKQINDVLKTHVEYTFDLSPAHFAVLADNKYRIIKDLEQSSQVMIIANRENNKLVFHGQKGKVEDAVNVMKAFTENFVCLDTTKIDDVKLEGAFYAWIRVPRRHIPAVIGKGGSTIREIIKDSGLCNMFVNRSENPEEIICFEGSKEAVKRAMEVLSHILEFDGVYQKFQPEEDSLVGKYSSAHSVLRPNANAKPPRRSGSMTKGDVNAIVFDCRDEDDFPGLGSKK
ncbi:hypothetical protein BgAZ_204220 [Babesia gibsoni]|uniref:K Homology domain-containing protein n=1 Tax=Babesia gibsoni TaxID=33632 RepID=A0AAD8LRB8_BABGI|nr:hypothetical protein BgAZ_204220 [Babesia gibsoni]